MMADRTPANHKGTLVMVGYGDGHTKALKVSAGTQPGGRITVGMDGAPATWVVENPGSRGTDDNAQPELPDNVFDDVGDVLAGDGPLKPAGGSARRAWVK